MEIKTKPIEIWHEYTKLQEYCSQRHLYENVKRNENFYIGKQWEGVNAPDLPKPVINFVQRSVKYQIATLASNDVAVSIDVFSNNQADQEAMKPIVKEVENIIEYAKLKEASRIAIRNGAVDGSCYLMQLFNPDYDTKQAMMGRIENEIVDCTNVYFGNPYSNNIQNQPYIIIALRQHISQVKDEAERMGLSQDEIDLIKPDNDSNQYEENDSDNLVTVLLKFYKKKVNSVVTKEKTQVDENGNEQVIQYNEKRVTTQVFFTKTTHDVTLIEEVNLGYERYPLACFGWEQIKNSYLYESPITSVIPNQIFVNKTYALAQEYVTMGAFPKVAYDRNKIDINSVLGGTNQTLAVTGIDMMGKLLDFIKMPDFSNQALPLAEAVMNNTKECLGVNDASLGDVKPDNTSAIIALQEASNVPLELQRQTFYAMWEDLIRNILDIMGATYGTRQVLTEDGLAEVNFEILQQLQYDLRVDIGSGAQYSEIAQINTLDKLFQANVIPVNTYIDVIPDKYIPSKGKIKQAVEEQQEQQAQMMQQPML